MYFVLQSNERSNLDLLCFFQATYGRFKRLCTVLKTRIGLESSRLEGSRDEKCIQQSVAREVEGKGFLNFFKFKKFS